MGRISREKLGVVICQKKVQTLHHQVEEPVGLQMVQIQPERLRTLGLVRRRRRHRKKMANKAFKSDSQRMAFFIPSLGFVFMVQWFSIVAALLTP